MLALEALATQHFRGGEAGRAAADDHDLLRPSGVRARRGDRRRCRFLAHEHLVVAQLGRPARDGAERRRPHRFAGPQAEARVVPRAAHGVVDHQPFRERTVVVRAVAPIAKNSSPRRASSTASSPTCPASILPSASCRPRHPASGRDPCQLIGLLPLPSPGAIGAPDVPTAEPSATGASLNCSYKRRIRATTRVSNASASRRV